MSRKCLAFICFALTFYSTVINAESSAKDVGQRNASEEIENEIIVRNDENVCNTGFSEIITFFNSINNTLREMDERMAKMESELGKIKKVEITPDADSSGLAVLHQYYNSQSGDHFYTISDGLQAELAKINYAYEGRVGQVFKSPTTGTLALHRYYNSKNGDHFYTTNWNELGGGKGDYKYENMEGFIFEGPTTGAIPLYRYYKPSTGDHYYTSSWNALKEGKYDYRLESIQGYVFP